MVLLALIAPLSYGIEANFLAWRGSEGLHPFQLLLGASLVGIALTWPLAAATGQTVDLGRAWGPAEWAILASGVLNALAYSGYVWLVGRAGLGLRQPDRLSGDRLRRGLVDAAARRALLGLGLGAPSR